MKKETAMIRKLEAYVRGIFICCLFSAAYAPAMNFLQPFEPLLRPDYNSSRQFQAYSFIEAGFNEVTFDRDGGSVNVLQMYSCDQDALKMLDGFPANSCIGQKRIAVDADDDGVRGHFNVCGDLKLQSSFSFNFRWFCTDAFSVGFYFPFYAMSLKNVHWRDLTLDQNEQDFRVKELLTDHFSENVCKLGGPSLRGWERTGPGDAYVMLEWYRDFRQAKPLLKNARINWRAGVCFPTGLRTDEDKLFAIPFGYDGAFSIPYGLGLDLTFGKHLRIGGDVQLTHIFDNTKTRRIKTDVGQTELILLEKVCAHKDWGMVQRFELYVELYRFLSGLSTKVGYYYLKQGDSTLSFPCNEFSAQIANTAQSLQDYTQHQIFLKANYDLQANLGSERRIRPQIGFFGRFPFNGKRTTLASTLGVVLSVDF